ncbi:hypothetical protein LSCM4_04663 [Leishmania orientalis]|uniref:Uncharacterized protein n=1 Tax=Leishmania orientalis TaxID=2249476 RepID=A0A836KPW6_9TRYP|nr:hypothetical protein LSCM4_04663 [Leishmania orientalis]
MTASSVELEELKRRLIMHYEEEINAQLGVRASPAESDNSVQATSATPSYLYQRLLCLRAGRPYGVGVPTSASETVQLLAENQPPPEVMLTQRLHKAQDESVRLLAVHAAATAAASTGRESDQQDTAAATAYDATASDGVHEEVAIGPLTAQERTALLSKLAEAIASPPLAESTASGCAPAAGTHADDDVVADASEDQGGAANKKEEGAEEME